jgi:hypothetical protein
MAEPVSSRLSSPALVNDTHRVVAGTPICDVTIRIRDGNYVEEKQLTESDCILMGAGERPGTYRVTISRGDTVLAEDEVTVRDDGCHPIPESLEVVLDE